MDQPNGPPIPTHIPPFVRPLAPYVKTRQEALRIRQALTLYLRSLIVFADDNTDSPDHAHSHLALCVPADTVEDVKCIPADLTGLRKEYLNALQANVAARKGFRAVSEDIATLRRQRASKAPAAEIADPQEPGADLQDYLLLLRDRRRHAKLQVFQHYLEELSQQETPAPEEIDAGEGLSQRLPLDTTNTDAPGGDGAGTDLDDLVQKLERAVVRARTQLDREKQLLEKVKAQHDSRGAGAHGDTSSAATVRALQETRDELVQWVEDRLVGGGDPDESVVQDLPPEEIEEAQRLLEHQKLQICEQYAAYLQARRELLDAASQACQPIAVTSKPPPRPTYRNEMAAEDIQPPNPVDVLSFASEILVPLSKSQKALALQRSYLSGLLAKEKSTTLRALHRLSDESHLLPEYPILARQPRFKRAVAALSSRNQPESSDHTETDEVVSLAEAWAFAADAAATNERDYAQQKIALGTEVARDARITLGEVYNILHQDLGEVMQEDTERETETSDIWASEARSNRGPGGSGGDRVEKRPKGPWARLNGRVGVE